MITIRALAHRAGDFTADELASASWRVAKERPFLATLDGEAHAQVVESYIWQGDTEVIDRVDGSQTVLAKGDWVVGLRLSDEAFARYEAGDIFGIAKEWNEDAVERDENGRFSSGGGGSFSGMTVTGSDPLVQSLLSGNRNEDLLSRVSERGITDEQLGNLVPTPGQHTPQDGLTQLAMSWGNGNNFVSMGTQVAAVSEFGLGNSALPYFPNDSMESRATEYADDNKDALGAVLREQYNQTQEIFAQNNIDSVTMYRASVMGKDEPVPEAGDKIALRGLSSWAVSREGAEQFALSALGSASHTGKIVVYEATVPVAQIQSMPQTGFGVGLEEEALVLGRPLQIDGAEPLSEEKVATARQAYSAKMFDLYHGPDSDDYDEDAWDELYGKPTGG